jgi:hypothetical protein
MPILPALPAGLTIDRSIGPVYPGPEDGNDWGACITRNHADAEQATAWYGSDFRGPHGTDPMTLCAHFGPHTSRAAARGELEMGWELDNLTGDDAGTDGASAWLVLP